VLFAATKDRKTDFYLRGDPIAFIAMNLPSYMGGRANPWMGNPTSYSLQTPED
jgi:hypothetical protein